ncbi:thermonuclease family protein [Campylobacter sp. RM16191]|uniref:thermonuclease family protein n=1 Tax=Campylobacter sp. RM16191 TaxID=1705728 RepID=UPI0014755006|nr:thermonuclease family protein [Campylobacter sp. RM16191]
MKNLTKILILISLFSASLSATILEGKVVKISDGDTIIVLDKSKTQHRVRLFGIDAPELKQDYGRKAKDHLTALVATKLVKVVYFSKDKYKRILGIVFLNGIDINAQMVKDGFAWAFVKYSNRYIKEQDYAKENKIGLWSGKQIIAPWDFRKNNK